MGYNDKENKFNFFCVIVIYNINVKDSISVSNILKIKKYNKKIIVMDNSDNTNDNLKLCKELGITYINMHGNKGLSRAYNKALDYIRGFANSCNDVVIWFDDDSNINEKYFKELTKNLYNFSDVDIFAPVIVGQDNRFWSPNKHRFFKNKQLKNKNESIKNDEFNAINSCTAVRWNVYINYKYDEKLFLDQIDHDFFRDQRKLNKKFKKIDTEIEHNFSLKTDNKSLVSLKKRYTVMIPDFIYYCSKENNIFLGSLKVFGWGVRESISIRNFYFLIWSLKELYFSIRKIKEQK